MNVAKFRQLAKKGGKLYCPYSLIQEHRLSPAPTPKQTSLGAPTVPLSVILESGL
jgi:hypothetical protein